MLEETDHQLYARHQKVLKYDAFEIKMYKGNTAATFNKFCELPQSNYEQTFPVEVSP